MNGRFEEMSSLFRGTLGRNVAAAGLVALLSTPVFAQETPPSEYGQGAGVQRARTLPRTGDGSSSTDLTLTAAIAAAGLALGAAGSALYAARRSGVRVAR
jgi:hypothetical protein